MFRLNKHRSQKSEDRIEFKISHLKALQVPKGWDKLFVSVISAENGKIGKSSKVPVLNGSCQWSDAFSEYVWVSRDNISKEIDDCILRLVVAMGSSRSGILGEATVNVTSYVSSDSAIPLTIQLNKCNHGTLLQVTVQCLTPRRKPRHQESSKKNSDLKAKNDVAAKSNGSDCSHLQSAESSSIDDVDSIFSREEVETPAASLSGSVSNCSYKSAEGSKGFGSLSPCISDEQSPMGRQDSTSSQKIVSHKEYPVNNSPQYSSFNSKNTQRIGSASSKMTNASKNVLEAAEDTSEELQAEANTWEMNAGKLMGGDFDMLKTEFSDDPKNLASLEMDLSAAYVERDSFKKQVEKLKLSSGDSTVRLEAIKDSISRGECIPKIENAIKDELKFQKESNATLSLQLKKSQDANVELLSVLQELEETIEQQKLEIENLSSLPSKLSTLEKSFQLSEEGNRSLMHQIEQLEELKKKLLVKVQELEEELEDKMQGIEHAKVPNNKTLSDIEMEYESKLSAKEEETSSLKTRLFETHPETCYVETVSNNVGDADLVKEIEVLKEKIQELEMDCNELTDENLELLFKLKEARNNSNDGGLPENLLSDKLKGQSIASCFVSEGNNVFRIFHSEDMLQGENAKKISNDGHISIRGLENSKSVPKNELTNLTSEMENLEANLSCKEKDFEILQKLLSELEAKVYHLEQDKLQLKEDMEDVITERTHETELQKSDIEKENKELSMQVSVLEAQVRVLTNKQESHLSELENSRTQATRLREKIMEMQSEMDSSIEDFKQKLKVTQFHLSEAQKECEDLRGENQQLQLTIENLAEECYSFEKLNRDLSQKKLELEEYCSLMGTRLMESNERFANCSGRVEFLENKYALMQEDIESKEKNLTSVMDGVLDDNRKHMEQGHSLLNQMQMEKMVEIQNLKLEVENLSLKLSAAYDDKERIVSDALLEVSALHAAKAKLESSLEEAQYKVILSKTEINMMQTQYTQKKNDLTTELADFKVKMEMLMAEHERLSKLVEDYESRELNFKSTINAIELKLTVTEYEKQQYMDESRHLKVQLQQACQYEKEIMALQNELNASNTEKENLEASLRLTSELCDDLEAEKISIERKLSSLEKAVSELEHSKRTRASLEEKLMQLENDSKARETRCVQDTELGHIKRIDSQHQQMQKLELEKVELQKKTQALEEELKLIKEQKRNHVSRLNRKPVHDDQKSTKNLAVKNTNQHRSNRKKPSSKNDRENLKDQQDPYYSNKQQSESPFSSQVETEHGLLDESVHSVEVEPISMTQLLETELAKAKEAKDIFEVQLNRSSSQGQNNQANDPLKSMDEGELAKEKFERTKSMLEAELVDIRERYFHMSLKYAEVEAEREELVMKLKVAKTKNGWLS